MSWPRFLIVLREITFLSVSRLKVNNSQHGDTETKLVAAFNMPAWK
jgi:hypothetical protein